MISLQFPIAMIVAVRRSLSKKAISPMNMSLGVNTLFSFKFT